MSSIRLKKHVLNLFLGLQRLWGRQGQSLPHTATISKTTRHSYSYDGKRIKKW